MSTRWAAALLEREEDGTRQQASARTGPLAECGQIAVRCGPVSSISIWFRSVEASSSPRPHKFVPSSVHFSSFLSPPLKLFERDGAHTCFGSGYPSVAWLDAPGGCRRRRLEMISHHDLLPSVRALLCVACCDLIGGHLLTFPLPCAYSAFTALLYPPRVPNMARAPVCRNHRIFRKAHLQGLVFSGIAIPLLVLRSVHRGRTG